MQPWLTAPCARLCRSPAGPRSGLARSDREAPVGLTDIALTFELDTDADAATLQRLVEMSERFCVIYQTLRAPPRLTVTHRTAVGA
ncbi:MAG: OsmC family protein [Stellaceae bacterium]